ncbi:MAG: bifunctional hydroxymethylpyrimidine kinase/phosphomethylpyrimidine kinase [Pseudomonadota bacterium]
MSIPIAVTIAGSDSSGGAGIQADLKTFSAFQVYGASVITALTAQNTQGVTAIHVPPTDFVRAQMDAVFQDLDVSAVKIGMLAQADIITAVVDALDELYTGPIVLDPVMVATSGDSLIDEDAEYALKTKLIPKANVITPNLMESVRLIGCPYAKTEEDMTEQLSALMSLKPKSVLLKGGHLEGSDMALDLFFDGQEIKRYEMLRIKTADLHGTGCTLSSAIAANLAKGFSLQQAIKTAKEYITEAIKHAHLLDVGQGAGPVHHRSLMSR